MSVAATLVLEAGGRRRSASGAADRRVEPRGDDREVGVGHDAGGRGADRGDGVDDGDGSDAHAELDVAAH